MASDAHFSKVCRSAGNFAVCAKSFAVESFSSGRLLLLTRGRDRCGLGQFTLAGHGGDDLSAVEAAVFDENIGGLDAADDDAGDVDAGDVGFERIGVDLAGGESRDRGEFPAVAGSRNRDGSRSWRKPARREWLFSGPGIFHPDLAGLDARDGGGKQGVDFACAMRFSMSGLTQYLRFLPSSGWR